MGVETLVTGGEGLVAHALKEIHSEAIFVSRHDCDLRERGNVRALFRELRPRRVIHLAAKVAGVKTNAEKNADMLTENVQINTHVLDAAREYGVEKLVTALSNCIFKEKPEKPPTEADVHIGLPFHGHLGYGMAKRLMDTHIHLLREQYGCKFTSLTPVTIFGPNDNWNYNEAHVVGSLIHKCFLAKQKGTPLEVWGSGKAVRQFLYSHDVARVYLETLEKYDDPDTVIVAADDGISIRTLAETIARVMDFKGSVQFNPAKPEGEPRRVLDSSKFKHLFPGFKFTPLEKALKGTVDWFLENFPTAKVIL